MAAFVQSLIIVFSPAVVSASEVFPCYSFSPPSMSIIEVICYKDGDGDETIEDTDMHLQRPSARYRNALKV